MTDPCQRLGTAVIVPVGGLALAWSAVARDSAANTQAKAAHNSIITALASATATTQSANDNSTKVATTAYVDAATAGSVGGAMFNFRNFS